jgi:hypothetical protein
MNEHRIDMREGKDGFEHRALKKEDRALKKWAR